MEHLFIINPVAGKGKSLKLIPQIEQIFQNKKDAHRIEVTEMPGHATLIAREYSKNGPKRIYSVGGDGTLNEVVNGVAGTNSSVAVIPAGSGNDFIKSICSDYKSPNILERTIMGTEKSIDLGIVNNRYFLNISSMGFDAEVANVTNKHKRLCKFLGKFSYITGIIETLFSYRNNKISLRIDDTFIETQSLLVAIANGRYYGGGMKPVPFSEIDDGMLDVCLIEKKNVLEIIRFLPEYMKGSHENIQGVYFYKGKEVEINLNKEVYLNIDGEVQAVNKARYSIVPGGLQIVIPCLNNRKE